MQTISGSTIIHQGIKGSYPFVEAILTLLPICDEFVVFVSSQSNDGTVEVLEKMQKRYGKIKILQEHWPMEMGPESISFVTNRCFEKCSCDWWVHTQADECWTEHAVEVLYKMIQENKYGAILPNRQQMGFNFQELYRSGSSSLVRAGRKGNVVSGGDGLSMRVVDENFEYLERDSPNIHIWDVTRTFVGNFPGRSYGQAEIWYYVPNRNAGGWFDKTPEQWAEQVAEWDRDGYPEPYTRTTSPFMEQLPELMKFWVGKPKWEPRSELIE